MKQDITLAIDMGGSKYMIALISREGKMLFAERFVWSELSSEGVCRDIITASRALLAKAPEFKPSCIGATIPGLADPENGLWVEASFSGIRNLPIASILSSEFSLPAYIDNDGQACALAEHMFGTCRDVDDFIYMTVSNGIGGGIFLDGRLHYGSSGGAGEFGHCVVVEDGRQCKCGGHGCMEVHAAGPGIAQNYIELGGGPADDGVIADACLIAQRARAGEKAAIATFELEGYYLGKTIALACNMLNPRKVVIGGGVSLAFDLFYPRLRETAEARWYQSANRHTEIEPSPFGASGGLYGAAAVSFSRHF